MDWLLKSDPDEYSFDDLERDGKTVWNGVANPVASKNLGSMKPGDRLVVYHTGKERASVGLAKVTAPPTKDPKNPKLSVVEITCGKRLKKPVTLDEVKANPAFDDSPLVRIGRLSVVPLTEPQYRFLAGD